MQKIRSRNYAALGLLVAGKLFGIAGLVVASRSRVVGGTFLGFDAILITAAIVMALFTMRANARNDDDQKALLRKMKDEGTLAQYLKDIEAEDAAAKTL